MVGRVSVRVSHAHPIVPQSRRNIARDRNELEPDTFEAAAPETNGPVMHLEGAECEERVRFPFGGTKGEDKFRPIPPTSLHFVAKAKRTGKTCLLLCTHLDSAEIAGN